MRAFTFLGELICYNDYVEIKYKAGVSGPQFYDIHYVTGNSKKYITLSRYNRIGNSELNIDKNDILSIKVTGPSQEHQEYVTYGEDFTLIPYKVKKIGQVADINDYHRVMKNPKLRTEGTLYVAPEDQLELYYRPIIRQNKNIVSDIVDLAVKQNFKRDEKLLNNYVYIGKNAEFINKGTIDGVYIKTGKLNKLEDENIINCNILAKAKCEIKVGENNIIYRNGQVLRAKFCNQISEPLLGNLNLHFDGARDKIKDIDKIYKKSVCFNIGNYNPHLHINELYCKSISFNRHSMESCKTISILRLSIDKLYIEQLPEVAQGYMIFDTQPKMAVILDVKEFISPKPFDLECGSMIYIKEK